MAQTPLHAEILSANEKYASEFGAKADLALPPGRQAAFIVCMVLREVKEICLFVHAFVGYVCVCQSVRVSVCVCV